jgi:hypothetical protein
MRRKNFFARLASEFLLLLAKPVFYSASLYSTRIWQVGEWLSAPLHTVHCVKILFCINCANLAEVHQLALSTIL